VAWFDLEVWIRGFSHEVNEQLLVLVSNDRTTFS
jgi:hypothetical protein